MKLTLLAVGLLVSPTFALASNCVTGERIMNRADIQRQAQEVNGDPRSVDLNINRCFYQAKINRLSCNLLGQRCSQEVPFDIMSQQHADDLRQQIVYFQLETDSMEDWRKARNLRWLVRDANYSL